MQSKSSESKFGRMGTWARLFSLCVVSVIAAGAATSGCLDRPLCAASSSADTDTVAQGCTPKTTNVFVDRIQQTSVDKIDLLLMIDNSISMADKQEILGKAIPDLVGRLVTPVCVPPDGMGDSIRNVDGECPPGTDREFQPIRDIHIGIITSSLFVGSDLCHPTRYKTRTEDPDNPELDDSAWLLGARPRAQGVVNGVSPEGFLDWNRNDNPDQLSADFSTAVAGLVGEAGENGCGFESSLEAWYRFLVDPEPYASIEVMPCAEGGGGDCAVETGLDRDLLAQRAAFLRPDSLVAVIMLSDENDCSIQGVDTLYYIAKPTGFDIPKAATVCATNPNDPCCYSCGLRPPGDCAADPACIDPATGGIAEYDPRGPEAEINLRCWEQKRRFGFDFLYPTDRYVNALSQRSLCMSRSDLAVVDEADTPICPGGDANIRQNGLFVNAEGVSQRSEDLVFLAGIIGVPWQDIRATEDEDGNPYPEGELRYLTAPQLHEQQLWSRIVATPNDQGALVGPTDALMIESRAARGGSNPVIPNGMLQGQSAGYLANPINGHEWLPEDDDDLMYACIFPLEMSRDCEALLAANPLTGCDCDPAPSRTNADLRRVDVEFNPLCQQPDNSYSPVQNFAKAYPGTRQLEVLRDFGDNSIVASICARNVSAEEQQDFGYRPAVDAIVDRLKEKLSGRCLPRELSRDEDGQVPCELIEAVQGGTGGCDPAQARSTVPTALVAPALERLKEIDLCGGPGQVACTAANFQLCGIEQLPEGNVECEGNDNPSAVGWCYIDDEDNTHLANCPDTEKRLLRFVDPLGNTPAKGATVLIACKGAELGN